MIKTIDDFLRTYVNQELGIAALPAISGIVADSRHVQTGNIFVACKGEIADGHQFIRDAVGKGAVLVVGTEPLENLSIPYIQVPNSRKALAYLSAAFHGNPAAHMTMIGVTGTDGKTTTANMIYSILNAAGLKTGMISTVNAIFGEKTIDTGFHVTTPDAPIIQDYLDQMVMEGIDYAVLEVTSHGLDQFRVEACEFDLAVFTNITHEHLDYHKSFELYAAAKGKLVQYLNETSEKPFVRKRIAVFNQDDSSIGFLTRLAQEQHANYQTYGLTTRAGCYADNIKAQGDGMHFDVASSRGCFHIELPMFGLYNISNCLAAIAATIDGLDIPSEAVQEGIHSLKGIPGRLERIDLGQDFTAIVDFAHTPNALQRSLDATRQITRRKIIAVFGSAGLRDQEKRRMMAACAVEIADITILTAEDPRTESLDEILAQMAEGAVSRGGVEGSSFYRIPDRRAALRKAVQMAQPGDLVIACGKGHEQSMCFGKTEYPWDDRTAMRAAISELLHLDGPEMPYLPT
jgi:UDP-N-acetylmuramoyl-L-alanyl-D-glutamate--2,6-diaminopimelate ligase